MKIVFVSNYWPYENGGTRIARIAPILAGRGYEVHVFTMPHLDDLQVQKVQYSGDIFKYFREILRKLYKTDSPNEHTVFKTRIISQSSGPCHIY